VTAGEASANAALRTTINVFRKFIEIGALELQNRQIKYRPNSAAGKLSFRVQRIKA
jgi:hypothetical protein